MKNKKPVYTAEQRVQNPLSKFSIKQYIMGEINPTSTETWDSEKYHIPRDRVHAFLSVPMKLEKFMAYGSLVTLDHFLHVYTLLPLRVGTMLLQLLWRIPSLLCFKFHVIRPHQVCDFLKFALLLSCTWAFCYLDTSIIYHKLRSQSIIKLYIFFNLLDVSDRLLSAVGQDALDSLTWTVVKTKFRMHHAFRVLGHSLVSFICMAAHAFVILLQTIILNVALNSHNKSILTIMLSNNFVEVKGSVFKRFAKNNLFQMACSDVRERFHLFAMLALVVFRNLSTSTWYKDDLQQLFMDVILVLISEVIVDWVKHAFITKFNDIPPNAYGEFTVSLSYDVLKVHENKVYTDYFDQASRRVGLTPLPLSCIINSIAYRTMGGSVFGLVLLCILPVLIVTKLVLHFILRVWSYSYVHAYEKESVAVVPNNGGPNVTHNPPQSNINDSIYRENKVATPHASTTTSGVQEGLKQPPPRDFTKSALAELMWLEQVKRQHVRRVRSDSHFTTSSTKSSRGLLCDYVQTILVDSSETSRHYQPPQEMAVKTSSTSMSLTSTQKGTSEAEETDKNSTPRLSEIDETANRPDVTFVIGSPLPEASSPHKFDADEKVAAGDSLFLSKNEMFQLSSQNKSSDSLTPMNAVNEPLGGVISTGDDAGDETEINIPDLEPRRPERCKSVDLLIDAVVGLVREETLRMLPGGIVDPKLLISSFEGDVSVENPASMQWGSSKRNEDASQSMSASVTSEETLNVAPNSSSDQSSASGDRKDVSSLRTPSTSNVNSTERDHDSSILGEESDVRQRVRTRTQSTSTTEDGVVTTFTTMIPSEQNPSAVLNSTELSTGVTVKQPLSDVDRYSMISSQIV